MDGDGDCRDEEEEAQENEQLREGEAEGVM